MAYIGNKPEVGNFRKCDAITTSATATYNLLVGGVAVNPNQNQCIVSLNGVIQSSGDSYTIASSQITFASALTSSDVIDFILILGDTLNVGTVSDDTIGLAQLSATGSPSSSNFLRGDNSWTDPGGVSLATSTNNQIVTVTGADAITGETNLSYDGTGVCLGSTTFSGAKINLYTGANAPANGAKDGSSIWFQNNTSSSAKMQMTFSGTSGSTYGPGFIGFNNESFTSNGKGYLTFGTRADETDAAPTERLRIKSDGNIDVKTGNLIMGTSGKGIDFSATSGTGTSEILDDYEEGTWTPTFDHGGDATGVTYAQQIGYYTKIGRLVNYNFGLVLTAKGSGTGHTRVDGLPFSSVNAGYDEPPAVLFFKNTENAAYIVGSTAGTRMGFWGTDTFDSGCGPLYKSNFEDNFECYGSGSYITAS
ncbi:hypothetical protein [uncultured Mediterranean phage]|nr:hypothetical protein [uncultured Mediterranean phage]